MRARRKNPPPSKYFQEEHYEKNRIYRARFIALRLNDFYGLQKGKGANRRG
jgi:hypothetical protein